MTNQVNKMSWADIVAGKSEKPSDIKIIRNKEIMKLKKDFANLLKRVQTLENNSAQKIAEVKNGNTQILSKENDTFHQYFDQPGSCIIIGSIFVILIMIFL